MGHKIRFGLAGLLSVLMAAYAATFSRQALDFGADLSTGFLGVEWLAWVPVLGFTIATGAAFIANARLSAVALVSGVIAFFVAQWRHVFDVPLGFLLVSVLTIIALFLLPSERKY